MYQLGELQALCPCQSFVYVPGTRAGSSKPRGAAESSSSCAALLGQPHCGCLRGRSSPSLPGAHCTSLLSPASRREVVRVGDPQFILCLLTHLQKPGGQTGVVRGGNEDPCPLLTDSGALRECWYPALGCWGCLLAHTAALQAALGWQQAEMLQDQRFVSGILSTQPGSQVSTDLPSLARCGGARHKHSPPERCQFTPRAFALPSSPNKQHSNEGTCKQPGAPLSGRLCRNTK